MKFDAFVPVLATLMVGATVCAAVSIQGLHVEGNAIKNGNGEVVILHGVDRSGMEFQCVHGNGIFDGPTDNTSIEAIRSWNVNAVRLPLNEDCLLGINGVNPSYSGQNYIDALTDFVDRLNRYGIAVVVDLHWTAPGSQLAAGQMQMPDADHAVAFWTKVASIFQGNSAVIFDLFNEPYPGNGDFNSTAAWQCWRDGGNICPDINYTVAGMQSLVDAVRSTGSHNIVVLGGLQWSNSLTQWLAYMPKDPTGQIGASWHSYNFNRCIDPTCWNAEVLPVLSQVPLIATELGENDCASGYIDQLLPWLDAHNTSYIAWTWNTWNCGGGPALIQNFDGTPTGYGPGYKAHLQQFPRG